MLTGYILRVAAVNKYGAGEPVETPVVSLSLPCLLIIFMTLDPLSVILSSVQVTTRSPYKAPQITEAPVISDVTENSCTLTWSKPTEDGGSPIYGYDVYRKENGGEWIKVWNLGSKAYFVK